MYSVMQSPYEDFLSSEIIGRDTALYFFFFKCYNFLTCPAPVEDGRVKYRYYGKRSASGKFRHVHQTEI